MLTGKALCFVKGNNLIDQILQIFIVLGFNQKYLSAQGFGQFRPLIADRDKKGRDLPVARQKNRRVSIEISGAENLHSTFK